MIPDLAHARRLLGAESPVDIVGDGFLRSDLPVSRLATAAFAALAATLARLVGATTPARIDRALCDVWLGRQVRADGRDLPSPWDPLSGAFATADGSWLRTHANAPHHRAALLGVLALPADADAAALARAISERPGATLESEIVAAGGVAGALRTVAEWRASAPGRAVAAEPLIAHDAGTPWDGGTGWTPSPERPLAGIRVLDLTRVIAGPASTQVLAGLGADVLRVDPPSWDEPPVLPYVMAGKRSARLDAADPAERARLHDLLRGADVLVHGYRAGAIDRLGLDAATRARLRPGLVEVAERAYGWSGPWQGRRGFDSVVQFSAGIAAARAGGAPVSLPVQALDWVTGYLAAAAAIAGLADRRDTGAGSGWRLSLARTAAALQALAADDAGTDVVGEEPVAVGQRLAVAGGGYLLAPSPLRVGEATLRFDRIPERLGVDDAVWL